MYMYIYIIITCTVWETYLYMFIGTLMASSHGVPGGPQGSQGPLLFSDKVKKLVKTNISVDHYNTRNEPCGRKAQHRPKLEEI